MWGRGAELLLSFALYCRNFTICCHNKGKQQMQYPFPARPGHGNLTQVPQQQDPRLPYLDQLSPDRAPCSVLNSQVLQSYPEGSLQSSRVEGLFRVHGVGFSTYRETGKSKWHTGVPRFSPLMFKASGLAVTLEPPSPPKKTNDNSKKSSPTALQLATPSKWGSS